MIRSFLFLLAILPLFAIAQSSQFVRMFGFSNTLYESAFDLMELPDKDIVLIGNSSKCAGTTCDHAAGMVRTDPEGKVKWFTKLGTAGVDMTAMATCRGNDGSLLMAAHYAGNSVLTKIDPAGNVVWHRMVSASGTFWPRSVVAYDGAYFVAGQIRDNTERIAYLKRIEEDGTFGWIRFFQTPGSNNEFHCIRVNDLGELVVVGTGVSSSRIVGLSFFDPAGNLLKTWGYKDTQADAYPLVEDLVITPDGKYALTFRGNNNNSFCAMELGSNGQVNWAKRYNHSPSPNQKVCIVPHAFGGYLLMGTRNFFNNSSSILSLRLDQSGNLIWANVIDNPNEDRAYRLVQAHNCAYLLGGMAEGMGGAGWLVIRTDSAGLSGMESGNPSVAPYVLPMVKDTFALNAYTYTYNESAPTLIIEQPTVLNDSLFYFASTPACTVPVGTPETGDLSWDIGPNPVQDFLHVRFAHKEVLEALIFRIFDLQGRVFALGKADGGKIDMRGLPKGLYLLELQAGEKTFHKKLIKN